MLKKVILGVMLIFLVSLFVGCFGEQAINESTNTGDLVSKLNEGDDTFIFESEKDGEIIIKIPDLEGEELQPADCQELLDLLATTICETYNLNQTSFYLADPEGLKYDSCSAECNKGESDIEVQEAEDLFKPRGCALDVTNKDIFDFVLTREELPEEYSKKNSWGDYIVEDKKINPEILEGEDNFGKYKFLSYGEDHQININLFNSINKAKDFYEGKYNNIKGSKFNHKIEGFEYGEKWFEYEQDTPSYGTMHHTIIFQIENYVFMVESNSYDTDEEGDRLIAKRIHDKACK